MVPESILAIYPDIAMETDQVEYFDITTKQLIPFIPKDQYNRYGVNLK